MRFLHFFVFTLSLTVLTGCGSVSSQVPVAKGDYPFGIPVSDKPGFCLSPFYSGPELVDVQGISAGSKVKCPFTGKVFLVPKASRVSGAAILAGVATGLKQAGDNIQRQQELDAYNARTRALSSPIQVQHSGTIYVAPRGY